MSLEWIRVQDHDRLPLRRGQISVVLCQSGVLQDSPVLSNELIM